MMAEGRKSHVLPYLDVPFQHAHPEVLKRMKRPANAREDRSSASRRGARCART